MVLGVNLDDLGDHRPGQRAAAERGARFPLVDAGFTKADVRAHVTRELGLRTWDKPAAACLASRVPYGTAGDPRRARSGRAGRDRPARAGLRALRVRHYDDLARIEVPLDDLARGASTHASEVVAAVRAAGYRYVTLDLEGLRSGNLNAALGGRIGAGRPGKPLQASLPGYSMDWETAGALLLCPAGVQRGHVMSVRKKPARRTEDTTPRSG